MTGLWLIKSPDSDESQSGEQNAVRLVGVSTTSQPQDGDKDHVFQWTGVAPPTAAPSTCNDSSQLCWWFYVTKPTKTAKARQNLWL